jgi:dsRNA-specific ribonuclease/ERCC4-related helicase
MTKLPAVEAAEEANALEEGGPVQFDRADDGAVDEAKEPVEARLYQIELLEAAKRENIVAFLETGAGKTMISAILIKYVLERTLGDEMVAVFIVDRIPLVLQQSKYVQKLLGSAFATATFHGDMGIDQWGEQRWAEQMKGKHALFLTAQVFLNALRHDVIHFEKVALLIFDEAHHATKYHPFNSIMREFYFPSLREGMQLPRIFGMSASPVKAKVKAAAEIESAEHCEDIIGVLQRNLHARVVVASKETLPIVDACAPKPDEFVLKYAAELGSVTVSVGDVGDYGLSDVDRGRDTVDKVREGVLEICEELGSFFVEQLSKSLESPIDSMPNSVSRVGSISPKVLALLDLLVHECRRWQSLPHVDSSFRCIVFVQRRDVAVGLTWLINQVLKECDSPLLEARVALGTRTPSASIPRSMRTTQSQQTEALRGFREGTFGILVATNVVEEGLDIAACGLVVMFNDIQTSKSYIQSRGRARHKAARYVAMIPESDVSARGALENIRLVRDGAEAMHTVVRKLGSTSSTLPAALPDIEYPDVDISDEHCLRSNTTRARVSPTAALDLVNVYCGSLPRDMYSLSETVSGPIYDIFESRGAFSATVSLPPNSPVSLGRCSVPQTSHTKAKRLAALDAYTELYKCGALDEHLFPRTYARRSFDSPATPKPKAAGKAGKHVRGKALVRERIVNVEPPSALRWPRPAPVERVCEDVFLYEIAVDVTALAAGHAAHLLSVPGSHRFGIVTKHPLHAADLTARRAPKDEALFSLVARPCFSLSPEQDVLATKYGLAVYQIAIDKAGVISKRVSPEYGSVASDSDGAAEYAPSYGSDDLEMPGFHVLPLTDADGVVDWLSIEMFMRFNPSLWLHGASSLEEDSVAAASLEYSLVQSRHDTKLRVYFTGSVSPTHTPKSSCKEFVGAGAFESFEAYYAVRHRLAIRDRDTPMLAGYSKHCIGEELRGVFYLVSEFCRPIPLSPWALYYVSLMPFWQMYLTLQEFRRRCGVDDEIPFDDFATALQPRRSSPHCKGINYERLEFLGDAILKVLVSISAFRRNPSYHEGLLTSTRDALVSNSFLCSRSVSMEVYNVLACTGSAVKFKSWPFYLACPQKARTSMSEKVLADVIESLLGLYFVKGGLILSARLLQELQIVPDMQSMLGRVLQASPRVPVDANGSDPRVESPRIVKLEELIGYRFKRKELLVEALTHSSYRNSQVLSYQRLEFLGDAVIGFLVLKSFYDRYRHLDPAALTLIREPALSNELFGRVSVDHGLHHFLWYDSASLERDIAATVKAFEDELSDEDVCETISVPKVLGDILESVIGAVVVDQDMTMEVADEMVHRLMDKVLDRFANPLTLARHPVTEMSQALQVQYKAGPDFEYEQCGNSTSMTKCTVSVNGVKLASSTGSSRRKAKRSAAQLVLQRIDPTPGQNGPGLNKRMRRARLAIPP